MVETAEVDMNAVMVDSEVEEVEVKCLSYA